MSDKQKFAFDKVNFILLAIGMAIVIIGFLLMTGPTSSGNAFWTRYFQCTQNQGSTCCFACLAYIDDIRSVA